MAHKLVDKYCRKCVRSNKYAESVTCCPVCSTPFNQADGSPTTETLSPGIDQIPFEGLEAIGAIFAEGETKYGRDNWKQQPSNKAYNQERTRHAIRHLMLWANGDRSENHLAKVAWFCVTTIWRDQQTSKPTAPSTNVYENHVSREIPVRKL